MSFEPVIIIGIGSDGFQGLSPAMSRIIDEADELWGSERLINQCSAKSSKTEILGSHLTDKLQELQRRPIGQRIVILASGDPGFFGIASSVLKILPIDQVVIYPQVSSLQTAFARIRVPWQDAALTSVHAKPINEVIGCARRYPKIGILTDPKQTPAWISRQLLSAGIPDCRAVVCENLGQNDEKITDTRLIKLPEMDFSALNILLLIHDSGWKPKNAIEARADSNYQHKNGLITKRDVRIMSISRLAICETDVIWDIGAGSGAMSIEMAEIVWRGKVYSIEKDEACLECMHVNINRFGVANVQIVYGEAPEALSILPLPNAVFIGGNGGKLLEILSHIEHVLQSECRIVANFTLLENLMLAHEWMQAHGCTPEITEVQFSYGSLTGGGTRLVPSNPVFILSGTLHIKEEKCPGN
jgi:precorrin-6Y C5,15-methyltransferase (decarboxylating)